MKKVISILVCITFLTNSISYALSPAPGSNIPGTRDDMYAGAQKLFAAKVGPGSIDFDMAVPDEFERGDLKEMNRARFLESVPADLPRGWEKNPILQKTDLIEALTYFRDNEARISKDLLDIQVRYFKVDEEEGELPIARIEKRKGEKKRTLVVHPEFVRMWNDIRKNDVLFEYTFDSKEKRVVSVAWGIFYHIAKHEMTDLQELISLSKQTGLRKTIIVPKSQGHLYQPPYIKDIIVSRNETALNYILGQYGQVNDAIWMWFLQAYSFSNTTRYSDSTFNERLKWVFESDEAREMDLPGEFPRLDGNETAKMDAINLARLINYHFYSRELESPSVRPDVVFGAQDLEEILPATGMDEETVPEEVPYDINVSVENPISQTFQVVMAVSRLSSDIVEDLQKKGYLGTEILSNRSTSREFLEAILLGTIMSAVESAGKKWAPERYVGMEIHVRAIPRGGKILFQILDNGPGFSPEVLEWIGKEAVTAKTGEFPDGSRIAGDMGRHLYNTSIATRQVGWDLVVENRTDVQGASISITLPSAKADDLEEILPATGRDEDEAGIVEHPAIVEAEKKIRERVEKLNQMIGDSVVTQLTAETVTAIRDELDTSKPTGHWVNDADFDRIKNEVDSGEKGAGIAYITQAAREARMPFEMIVALRESAEAGDSEVYMKWKNKILSRVKKGELNPEVLEETLLLMIDKLSNESYPRVNGVRLEDVMLENVESIDDDLEEILPATGMDEEGDADKDQGPRDLEYELSHKREFLIDEVGEQWVDTFFEHEYNYREEAIAIITALAETAGGTHHKRNRRKIIQVHSDKSRDLEEAAEKLGMDPGALRARIDEIYTLAKAANDIDIIRALEFHDLAGFDNDVPVRTDTETVNPFNSVKYADEDQGPGSAPAADLVDVIAEYAARIGEEIGPGAIKNIDDAKRTGLWQVVNLLHETSIEIYLPQSVILTPEIKNMLVKIDQKMKKNGKTLIVKRYRREGLIEQLSRGSKSISDKIKKIVITDEAARAYINDNLWKDYFSENLVDVRFLSIIMPEIKDTGRRTAYQAQVLMTAILARLIEKGDSHYLDVKTVLADMLENSFPSNVVDVNEFIERLAATEDETTDRYDIAERVRYFTDDIRAISLIKNLEIELRAIQEFWTYA